MKKMRITTRRLIVIALCILTVLSTVPQAVYAATRTASPTDPDSSEDSFLTELSKFPASYQSAIKKLHSKYPDWKFYAQNTGLDFTASVNNESSGSKSLVLDTSCDMLKSQTSADYNSGVYKYYDAGGWVHASPNTVAYFMDPRNFLNEKDIFQFEALSYNAKSHSKTGVENMLSGSFMYRTIVSYIDTSGKKQTTTKYYSDLIMTAAKSANVSPYFLTSKILTEIGSDGSGSVSGNYTSSSGKKYVGYYNFYNIGAYDGTDPIANGLAYASSGTSYSRPWTTPEKSIVGGAKIISEDYIAEGQDTEYYQRFNVSPNSTYPKYTHQYMTNVMAAASQARNTYDAYSKLGLLANEKIFYIPVYNNMPNESVTSLTSGITLKSTSYPQTATVDSNNVNVRTGPNVSYPSAGMRLSAGTKVTIVDKTRTYTSTPGALTPLQFLYNPYWAKIKFTYNGTTYSGDYYISFTYLDITSSMSVSTAEAESITYTLSPSTSKEKPYFTTNNSDAISLTAKGSVKAKSTGSALVIATTLGGGFDFVTVNGSSDPTGISVTPTSSTIYTGDTLSLTASVTPSGAKYGSYVWSSSDKSVATVSSSGKVTAVSAGSATISVKTTNANFTKSAKCTVTVKDLGNPKITASSAVSNTSVKISWSAAEKADGYRLYTYNTETKKYTKIAQTTATSYTVKNLTCGDSYVFVVRAFRYMDGYTAWSAISPKYTVKAVPPYPTLSSVAQSGDSALKLTWKKGTDVTGYEIYRSLSKSSGYSLLKRITSASTVTYTNTGLELSTTYYYKVRAYKTVNSTRVYSSFSSVVSGTTAGQENLIEYKTTDSVNYRTGAGTSYSVAGTLATGKTVNVVDGYSKSADGYTWYKIKIGTSYYYCVKNYLTANEKLVDYYTTDSVNYRSGPGTSYDIKGSFPAKQLVKVVSGYSKSANGYTWYKIKLNSSYYYCAKDYLSTSTSGTTNTGTTTTTETLLDYKTTTDLNYRSGPGTTYSVKGTLASGKAVKVVKGYSKSANGYTWYKIKIGSTYYYCVKDYLAKVTSTSTGGTTGGTSSGGTTTTTEKLVKYTTTTSLNYRSGAGTTYAIKGTLSTGKTVNVVDGYSKSASGYTWYKIKIGTAYYYCVKDYLTKTTTTSSSSTSTEKLIKYYATADLNYRSGAGTSYAVKGTLASGKAVNVVDGYSKSANGYTWYKIKIGTSYYYCVKDYLSKTAPTSSSSTGTTTTTEKLTTYYATTELNYRSGAGTSYAVKGTITSSKAVNVVDGYSKSANGYTWYKIKIGTAYYYCVKDYLKFENSSSSSSSSSSSEEVLLAYKTTTLVNYRSGPGTSYSVTGTLPAGYDVTVVKGYSKTADGYTWYKIKVGSKYHYCVKDFIAPR
ncbi:MAG: SH3 domain-containing protein [Acutalibacteraceae bacterium]